MKYLFNDNQHMKKLLQPITLAIIISAFTGCNFLNQNQKKEEIKIGIILPFSGPIAEPSKRILNGIKLALNESDTSTFRITLVIEDSKTEPTIAVSAFNKLISANNCKIVIGELLSSSSLAMMPIANRNKVLLISPTASNPNLSKPDDYFFRVWASDFYDAKAAIDYIADDLMLKTAAIVYWNNDYAIGLKNIFINEAKNRNLKIDGEFGYANNTTDFKTIISKIKTSSAEVIYLPGNPLTNGNFIKLDIIMNLTPLLSSKLTTLS